MAYLIKIKWTTICFFIGLFYWVAHLFVDIDLCEQIVSYMQQLERYEVDEFFVLFFITLLGLLMDLSHHSRVEKQAQETMAQKLRTVHGTATTLEDLLGNKLISLKLLVTYSHQQKQITTENYDEMVVLIQDSLDYLRKLGNLTVLNEKEDALGLPKIDLDEEGPMRTPK